MTGADVARRIIAALEADAAARSRRIAAVDAQPVPPRVFIRVDARRGRRRVHAWVTGVSFAPGDGYRIVKVHYHDDPIKAKQFGPDAGRAIARQLAGDFNMVNVTLEGK